MKMLETIVGGVVATLIALYLDRLFQSGKRKRERREKEHDQLLSELWEIMDFVEDLIEVVERGDTFHHKRDRLQRFWESLKKRIPENEKDSLSMAFGNAGSALSMGQDSKNYALKMLRNLKATLAGVNNRLSQDEGAAHRPHFSGGDGED